MNGKHYFSHFFLAFLAAFLASGLTLHFASRHPSVPSTAPPAQAPGPSASPPPLLTYSGKVSVVDAVKRLGPVVVNINTVSMVKPMLPPNSLDPFFHQFFGENPFQQFTQPYRTEGAGSGVIIDKSGIVVTNEHVVHKAQTITVTLTDNRKFEARVIGSDPLSDVAILRIKSPPANLPVAALGDSSHLEIGEWVVAIGNPYGFHNTVTVGVLSAQGRSISGEEKQYQDLLQTDAAINPGNSGGPLADLTGAVIGINTAIIPFAQGIGFAIPIDLVKRVAGELIATGHVKWPFLGINMEVLTPQLAKYLHAPSTEGALIVKVLPDSPAEKSGLKRGDILVEIAGNPVNNPDDLALSVRKHQAGETVSVKFYRDGKLLEREVKLGERPSS